MIEIMGEKRLETFESDKNTDNTLKTLTELDDYQKVFRKLSTLDWNFHEASTSYLTHNIHPYPAKFIPQIPSQLISSLSRPGELVWDPFGGAGTTALEALLLHRRCISNDINPLANLIGQTKTTTLSYDQEKELTSFLQIVKVPTNQIRLKDEGKNFGAIHDRIPPIPHLEKWFHRNAIFELAHLKFLIEKKLSTQETRNIALVALSKTIGQVSNQDAETRYACRPREIKKNHVLNVYGSNLKSILKRVCELRSFLGLQTAKFTTLDLRFKEPVKDEMPENSVDLIVTSPPYPNATDYHLYHRFRLFWLGYDPRQLAKIEIGSHLRHQKERNGFDHYLTEMESCLKNLFLMLRPSRYAAIIVGDAIYHGQLYATAEEIVNVAAKIGFQYVGIIRRKIHDTQRSFIGPAQRAKIEKILILQKPSRNTLITLEEAQYKLWPYEKVLKEKEVRSLLNRPVKKFGNRDLKVHCSLLEIDKLRRLTFTRAVSSQFLSPEPTWQAVIENSATVKTSQLKKESKYVTHGIHSYKGKFYPQLVKVLFNLADLNEGHKVLDPFCGSGTVPLEGCLNGIQAYGCDLNPLAVEIAKAKTEILTVGFHNFEQVISGLLKRLKNPSYSNDWLLDLSEDVRTEISRWFPEKIAGKLGWLLSELDEIPDLRIRRFLRVLLSNIIRQISQQEPRDLRIRRRREPIHDAPVFELFRDAIQKNTLKILRFAKIVNHSPYQTFFIPKVWLGDSRDYTNFRKNGLDGESIDAILTSPPYATALPYIDTDRLSLLTLFGLGARERSRIEKQLTGSREITLKSKREIEDRIQAGSFDHIASPTARETIWRIYSLNVNANVGFRRKNMATLLYRYFNDMSMVMGNLDQLVKTGRSLFFVMGDNKTIAGGKTVQIETTKILQEIGKNLGWNVQELIPITVTQENFKHIRHAITKNTVIWFRKS